MSKKKIELLKFYKTRCGYKALPVNLHSYKEFGKGKTKYVLQVLVWETGFWDIKGRTELFEYEKDGTFEEGLEDDYDLVELWKE
jgi:hypothetical protein